MSDALVAQQESQPAKAQLRLALGTRIDLVLMCTKIRENRRCARLMTRILVFAANKSPETAS